MLSHREIAAAFWMFVLFLAQNALNGILPLREPVFLIAGILFFALSEGPWVGAMAGVFAGLCLELFATGRMGFEMAVLGAFGAVAGFSVSKIFLESVLTKSVMPAVALYFIHLANMFVEGFATGQADFSFIWRAFLFSETLIAFFCSPTIFSWLSKTSADPYRRSLKWPTV